jgi:5'-3' exonuclease
MRELLIDADIFVYKATRLSEREINWGGDSWTLHCDLAEAKTLIDDQIWKVKEGTQADKIILCFTDKNNFRKIVNPDYKSNRKGGRKPMCFIPALEYCKEKHPFKVYEWLEADDTIGILATEKSKDERIIVSEDKDLLTIPGLHWDFKEEKVFEWSKKDADYRFFYQSLVGDSTDNYKGCQGVGPISADKILTGNTESVLDMWTVVNEAFIKSGQGTEGAVQNCRMARILRDGEYFHDKHEVVLWTPHGVADIFKGREHE